MEMLTLIISLSIIQLLICTLKLHQVRADGLVYKNKRDHTPTTKL